MSRYEDEEDDRPARGAGRGRGGNIPRRRRDDEEDDYDDRPRRGRFRCPYCGVSGPPAIEKRMNGSAWAMFVVLLLFCFPLFWLPFVTMKEEARVCRECGMKLG